MSRLFSIVFVMLFIGFSALSDDHLGRTETESRPIADSPTLDALKRFLTNPEQFINEEKRSFLEKLEISNPDKAAEARIVLEKYEEKLKKLNDSLKKNKADKSLEEILADSELRKQLAELEEDLSRLISVKKEIKDVVKHIKKQKASGISKSSWYELIDQILDKKAAADLKKVVDAAFDAEVKFHDLKSSIKGKPTSEIPKEVLAQLAKESKEVREFRQNLSDMFDRIEKDLIEKGIIKEIRDEVKENEKNIIDAINHNRNEAEKIKNKINGIFK